ncbi:MAG: glycosyltransferase family 8 protein [Erysipelotrichaceae bacterium]|nr:glycosyltransferase family 8 protein [Erysipelotrichaceae bacterium]
MYHMSSLKEVTMGNNTNKNSKVVPVFFGADQRFTPYLMVCLASLLDHVSARRKYEIHILHTDINEKTQQDIVAMSKPNVSIEFNDVSPIIDSIVGSLPIRDYYSPSTYFRFVIASSFPQYDKALYVDADTVICQDLAKLFDTQIGNSYVAAVPEAVMSNLKDAGDYAEKVLSIARGKYFNAGMILINCKQWRNHDVLGQFLTLIGYYNFVVAQDQDYLNVICKNKVHYLPRRWNMETIKPWNVERKHFGIVHYAFAAKPWQDINCIYGNIFWKYASQLPVYMEIKAAFAAITPEKLEAINLVPETVCETCRKEIKRNDNFLRRVNTKKGAKPLFAEPQLADLVTRLRTRSFTRN